MKKYRELGVIMVFCLLISNVATAEIQTATIQFGGDVLIHQALLEDAYDAETDRYDFTHMIAPVADRLSQTDLTVLNLEVPIAHGKYGGYPRFNSPPALLDALAAAGVDVLLTANNHALDRLGKGARQTIEAVEAAGMRPIGTARSREEYNSVPLFDLGGISVAIFAYTQHTNCMQHQDDPENLRYLVHYFAVHRAERDVAAARAAGADFVILCVHWGKEYERQPTKGVREWAQALCGVGADLIIGGHPHVLQPFEALSHTDAKTGESHEALVLYSMGNLLSGQRDQYRDSGALLRFTLEKDTETGQTSLSDYGYIPTWVWRDDASGQYVLLEMTKAIDSPPEWMGTAAYERLRAAWEETVDHMGRDNVIGLEKSP